MGGAWAGGSLVGVSYGYGAACFPCDGILRGFDERESSSVVVNNCVGWAGPCKQSAGIWFIIRPNERLSSGAGERGSRVPRFENGRVLPVVMKGYWYGS